MKLVELISYFRNGGSFEDFCQSRSLDIDSEVIEIYMEKPYNIENRLAFFESEKTDNTIEHTFNGVKYYNLFDFYYFLDVIEESNSGENTSLTDIELAQRLFNYALYDA